MADSVVTEVIDRLGGIIRTAAESGLSPESIYEARRRGHFLSAAACVRLARVVEPEPLKQLALVARLAGVES